MCRSKVCFILRGHVWYVTRILISCGCCLFSSGKIYPRKEHFNFFWNAKLFLRLYKGFRSFNLSSKVSPGSEWLKAIFFCQEMRWFPAMFCHAGPCSLVSFIYLFFFFAGCQILSDRDLQIKKRNWSYINYGELHCDSIESLLCS